MIKPEKDVSGMVANGASLADLESKAEMIADRSVIEFYSPTQIRSWKAAGGVQLVGDHHVTKGQMCVLGGPPGVGKSRATTHLAICGMRAEPWFGFLVHRRFRTLIIQAENAMYRLSTEFLDVTESDADDYIRVSNQPLFGFRLGDQKFRRCVQSEILSFEPDLVILDPWNMLTSGKDNSEDYMATYSALRDMIPAGESGPAVMIVAHTRKPLMGERRQGRYLSNMLAGSYVLSSVPRSVFVLQPASDYSEDDRVVMTCSKNNNGKLGARTVWKREDVGFSRIWEFDWIGFDKR